MSETFYDLSLHETVTVDHPSIDVKVTRVPGGWIYQFYDQVPSAVPPEVLRRYEWMLIATVFVPFDNEFQKPTGDDLLYEEICKDLGA